MEKAKSPFIAIFRSNAIFHDPRVGKTASTLCKDYPIFIVGWDRSRTLPRRQSLPEYELELFDLKSFFGRGIDNLLHLLGWQIFLAAWVTRHRKEIRVIHACDFDTVLPAIMGKLLFKIKVVYDIFDFYADHVRNTPEWIKKIVRRIDYWVIKRVDAVVLVIESQISQLRGTTPRKMEIIYNTPVDTYDPLAPVEPSNGLKIAYVGTMQVERGVVDVIEAVRRHPTWHLDLAGFGGDEELIHGKAAGLPNVSWLGRIDYREALQVVKSADVLFSICDPQIPNYRIAIANKVFEAMMMGKPIVVARDTYMEKLIEEHHCGLVITYGDLAEIEAAFLRLENDAALRLELGRNGRAAYAQFYDWELMEKRLLRLYGELN